jgi:hypothetical protein
VGDRELTEHLEVKGYADAARWVGGKVRDPRVATDGHLLTRTELRQVHRMALGTVHGAFERILPLAMATVSPADSCWT